jgi:hypothetical protein
MAGDSPLEILDEGNTTDVLSPKRGGKATEVSFESAGRPSLKATFKSKNNGTVEFCIAIDRAITIAPDGISAEPCQDGDTTTNPLETAFNLDCSDVRHEFFSENTWRVADHCDADFPNLRIIP